MAYVVNFTGTNGVNFLESEVGLVTKTYEIPQTLGTDDGYGHTIVAAGTVYPSDDSSAVGIVFTDTDVTYGDAAGSVMLAGRVLNDRLTVSDNAKTALTGITFVDAPEVTRT